MDIADLISKIKQAKKYKTLSEGVIRKEIELYIKRNPKYDLFKEKKVLKDIKANLHRAYASFQIGKAKRDKHLEEFSKEKRIDPIIDILKTNRSTKERLVLYEFLYRKLFDKTGKPESILDLGCGLNPFSFAFMGLEKVRYSAYDIDESDIEFINNFFRMRHVF